MIPHCEYGTVRPVSTHKQTWPAEMHGKLTRDRTHRNLRLRVCMIRVTLSVRFDKKPEESPGLPSLCETRDHRRIL